MTEGWGPSVDLSAPLCAPACSTKRQRLGPTAPVFEPPVEVSVLDTKRFLFCEFFAGEGALTSAVTAAGVPARSPEDLAGGGVDFSDKSAVDALRPEFEELSASGVKCVVHFAPPCSTFSRARDRSSWTRLRSGAFPGGMPKRTPHTHTANLVARNTLDLAEWLVRDLGMAVSIENPERSYLWLFLDFSDGLPFVDATFSACMFGTCSQKNTRLRCWNWSPTSLLGQRCSLKGDLFSCGRPRAEGHVVLEFGSASTADAAAYSPDLCRAWASDVRSHFETVTDTVVARDSVRLASSGVVRRHVLRGETDDSAKEVKAAEDLACTAGCRNPAALADSWPELWTTMALIREVLCRAWTFSPDLRGLSGCCGSAPSRPPPLEASILAIRHELERLFKVPTDTFDEHHVACPWRAQLIGTVLSRTKDPDAPVWVWLMEGAPMGLACPITPGTHFPRVEVDQAYSVAVLDKRTPIASNHPSFNEVPSAPASSDAAPAGGRPPAWDLLEAQVNDGFAMLFHGAADAEAFLGGRCHPAPLGNVVKLKEDGTYKHRLIQDLRANGVNGAVVLPERQVLPRGIDHGLDLALLGHDLGEDEQVFTLVLDFKDAFMSIPLHEDERRFNCAHTGFQLSRTRTSIYDGEPERGGFVVWRTLCFGGRPNPLVFSRVASFACRTAQALLGTSVTSVPCPDSPSAGRAQLYVDDPIVSVRATEERAKFDLDLVMLWWLVLGIPLSWKKGHLTSGAEPHRWIGIDYTLTAEGAILRLPPAFVADLLVQLQPLCASKGFIKTHDLDALIGRVGRVAYVVPTAKPFVAGLWAGLAEVKASTAAGNRGAPPGMIPCRRLCHAASWIRALVAEDESCPLLLERLVTPLHTRPSHGGWVIEFDASIYGGGALLRDGAGHVVEYFSVVWTGGEAPHLKVAPDDTSFQSFWEFSTLLLALCTWGDSFVHKKVSVLGDNTSALQDALALSGKGIMNAVAREISWRQSRRRWAFDVGHLPSEFNVVADALSRVADPKGGPWPSAALSAAKWVTPPKLADLWLARPR